MPTRKPDQADRDDVMHPVPATPHLELNENMFIERFVPVRNPIDDSASFDFGEGGCLFAPFGQELEFVRAQPPGKVWTVIEGDDSAEITNGIHFVNRLGYLVTEHPCFCDTFVTVALDS